MRRKVWSTKKSQIYTGSLGLRLLLVCQIFIGLGMCLNLSPSPAYASSTWEYISASRVRCESPGECPASVGAMATVLENGNYLTCGFTAIAQDLVITASHCLAPTMRQAGAQCSSRVKFFFPAVGAYPEEQADCAEVVQATPHDNRTIWLSDYAVLRLSRPIQRSVARLTNGGLAQDEVATGFTPIITTSSLNSNAIHFALRRLSCNTTYDSVMLPQSVNSGTSVQVLGSCYIRPGMSGTALFKSNGAVSAVIAGMVDIQGATEEARRENYINTYFGDHVTEDLSNVEIEQLSVMAVATNLACIDIPSLGFVAAPNAANTCTADGVVFRNSFEALRAIEHRLQRLIVDLDAYRQQASERVVAAARWRTPRVKWQSEETVINGYITVSARAVCRHRRLRNASTVIVPNIRFAARIRETSVIELGKFIYGSSMADLSSLPRCAE